MTQAAVAVVQAYYDALAQGDIEGLFAVLAADAVLEEAASLPYAGVYEGHGAWREFATVFNQVWQDPAIAVESIADAGDYVIGLARLRAKSRHTGQTIDMPLAEFFFLEAGKIKKLLPFYWDTAAVVRAIAPITNDPASH